MAEGAETESLPNRVLTVATMLVPGGLTVYLAFNAGGYFPDETGFVAAGLAVLLALRVTVAEAPFEGLRSPWLRVALVALALFTVWTLASSAWSDAPARALLEYDRALLYMLLLALLGSVAGSSSNARWVLRGLAVAALIVCVAGLVTRLLPDVWPTEAEILPDRLSYPITYWNTVGLLAAGGILVCIHLTTSEAEALAVRAVAAAAVAPLAATLVLTFSRGAIAAGALALVVFIVAGRPRLLVGGLLSALPFGAVAAIVTYRADDVVDRVGSAAAVAQGKDVALAVAACAGGAAALRVVLGVVDRWQLPRSPLSVGRSTRIGITVALAAGLVTVAVALDAPGTVSKQYDRFVSGDSISADRDPRERLTNPGNNSRLDQWGAAVDEFERQPWTGRGAGTYALTWLRDRPSEGNAQDAHSLYAEVLGELGLVGIGLLVIALTAVLVGLAIRTRDSERALYAALFAVVLAWCARAGVDWDWEMPVVTIWPLAVAGVGLAAPAAPGPVGSGLRRYVRVAIALGLVIVAVTPVAVAVSQRRLNTAVAALERGDCRQAIDSALGSISAIGARPEPYEVLGYCDLRLGRTELAERAFRAAVTRDPDNWEAHYGLAIARAAAGHNPAVSVRTIQRLNPRAGLVVRTARGLLGTSPGDWRRYARSAPPALP